MTLKISKFSKRYNNNWILRDVSLEINAGEILGLIGDIGSGKSTLLRLIHGSEKSNSGEIFFNGRDLTATSEKERGFSLPINQPAKGWRSLFSGTGQNTVSDSLNQIDTFLSQLENSTSVILLDNPFSTLSDVEKVKYAEILKKTVKEKNLIAIIATNNSEEAFEICDSLAVLANGYLNQLNSPREVYEKPATVSAAKALGHCNFIASRRITFNNQKSLEFQTLTGEHRLHVDKMDKSMLGAITNNITLAIRPEHISISFGASFPEDNLLKAEISKIHYQGATTRILLNANGLILEALVLRLVGLNIGDECMVGLPPDRILVLKD